MIQEITTLKSKLNMFGYLEKKKKKSRLDGINF